MLDLGCGLGHFAREARARGAREVVGVDLSERMLAAARARTTDAAIVYVRAALEAYEPETCSFDLVVSLLVPHYVADYPAIVRRLAAALVPGGRFAYRRALSECRYNATRFFHMPRSSLVP